MGGAERARARVAANGEEASTRRYRELSRALEALPRVALPADFAARVARRAELEAPVVRVEPVLASFEKVVVSALVAVFVLGVALGLCDVDLLAVLGNVVDEARGATGTRWLLALAACVAVLVFHPLSLAGEGRVRASEWSVEPTCPHPSPLPQAGEGGTAGSEVGCQVASDLLSITNRYFTSLLSMRS